MDNESLESTFQKIKKITGITNIKNIVDKVCNKDKNYNLSVSIVNEREIKLGMMKEKIKHFDDELKLLNNSSSIIGSNKSNNNFQNDEELNELIEEEQRLKEELNEVRENNENVELIYQKVIDNMKVISNDKKHEDSMDSSKIINFEDDVIKHFNESLLKMNDLARKTYSKVQEMIKLDIKR